MLQSLEWSKLMDAPWGKFDKNSKELKAEAQAEYQKTTTDFWKRRNRDVPVTTTR